MIIAFIPVRGGSKGIPNKNIKSFLGKPLIFWTMSELQATDEVDKIIIATDSDEIKNTALSFGFNKVEIFDRNETNAKDHSSTESVMLEYLNTNRLNNDDQFIKQDKMIYWQIE